jgi:hypothetical protein
MSVPNTFASATSSIPLANLDANFAYYDAAFSISGTAVTFAGSITLTTGTANGVPYLNASKVLTSGAVLTFDGTTLLSTKFAGALNGTVGATLPTTGAFTTLSMTGTAATNTTALSATGTTTGFNRGRIFNTGGDLRFGIDSSVGAEAVAGSAAYSSFIGSFTNTPFCLVSNSAIVGAVSSTGLAVTGTLSATGTATFNKGATAIDLTPVSTAASARTNISWTAKNASSANRTSYIGSNIFLADGSTEISGEFAVNLMIDGVTKTALTSTGLAVTGTLSATGATTLSAQLTASTGDGTYPIISKDTRAFSVGVTGPQLGFFGLDSTSTNNSLGAIRALAQSSQNGTLEARVLSSGSIATIGTFSSTGLAVTGTLSATSNIYTSARYFAQRQSGSLSFAIGGYSDGSAATVLTGAIGDIVAFGNVGGDGVIFANSNTERMRLTDTGLGIGTSSPAYRLDVGATSDVNISMNNSTSVTSGNRGTLSMYNSAGSTVGFIRFGAVTDNSGTDIQFGVRPAGGSLNSTAMKLDSSGNLLVGNTVASSATDAGFKFLKSLEGAGNDRTAIVFDSSSNSQIPFTLYSTGAGAYRFYVGAGGTIYATSIVITAISDQRLKENVRDIDTGLSSVMALKPRRFDWKEGKGQDKKNVAGFIAQEFEDVFPECVGVSRAGEDGVEYKNINHETLIPTLVKAIQELKAEFDAYKASHP